MSVYFTRLQTNLRGTDQDITLGRRTAIIRPNRSGKTSVLDGVRLALTGKHDIGGHPSDLAELLGPGQNELYATLTASDGTYARWALQRNVEDGTVKRPKAPAGTYPIGDAPLALTTARSVLALGKDKFREELLRRFASAALVATPTGLNAQQQQLWAASLAAVSGSLADLPAELRTRQREQRDNAVALHAKLAALDAELAATPSVVVPAAQLEVAREWHRAAPQRAQRATLQEQRAALMASAPTAYDNAEYERLLGAVTAAEQLVSMLERDLSCCVVCGTRGDLRVVRDRIATNLAPVKQQLTALATRRADALAHQTRLSAIDAQLAALSDLPESYTGPELTQLEKLASQAQRAADLRTQVRTLKEQLRQCEWTATALAVLLGEAVRLMTAALGAADTIAERINAHMPDGFRAALTLTDKAAHLRVCGADGHWHREGGMSGAEFGALSVALAAACGGIILLDDVDLGVFDPTNLRALLTRLRDAEAIAQVIVCWSRRNEIPDGYTIIGGT